jgi:BirA family transcriptional regulator, biotin operon repressor / biotin---[acetyl-CoA-carboxylase] ligase
VPDVPLQPHPPGSTGDAEVRHYPVGISVEQLASGWLRSENAPSGSTVLVDHEIGGRQRLGIPWKVPSARSSACAVVLHTHVRAEDEALLWTVALVAATRAADVRPGWPDLLFDSAGRVVGSVSLEVHFGAGIVESAIVSLRLDAASLGSTSHASAEMRRTIGIRFSSAVRDAALSAESDLENLRAEYDSTSLLIGSRVRASLLPQGEVRGIATGVSPSGLLVVESATGMIEQLNPINVLRVDPLP